MEERSKRIEATKVVSVDDAQAFKEADGEHTPSMHDFLHNDPKDKKRKNVRRPYPWEDVE